MFDKRLFLEIFKIKIACSTHHVPEGVKGFSTSESQASPLQMATVSRFIFPLGMDCLLSIVPRARGGLLSGLCSHGVDSLLLSPGAHPRSR